MTDRRHRMLLFRKCAARGLLLSSTAAFVIACPLAAQENAPQERIPDRQVESASQESSGPEDDGRFGVPAPLADDSEPVIVVTGIRETQRNSIETKRSADVIVDAIISDEIGETPDQSVGETLERIVGVTADRFKGSASEISIRGLGPFLGFSTLNGREVTNGSGDRAVSFQQFPSEIVNGVLVYKSQNASLVEGGTSGVIDLRTLRPLDAGRRRLRIDARGVYEALDDNIDGRNGLGYRVSGSYVDQFQVGDGELGISVGYARADESAPEDFYTESSSVRPCNTIGGGNCSFEEGSDSPTYFVPNSFLFRQSNNDQNRDAVIGTIQYKPRPELDINIDGQYSTRFFEEDRSDLVIAEGRRGITPEPDGILDNGVLIDHSADSRIESQTRIRRRDEEYYGGGLSTEWSDDFGRVGLDLSYSETKRTELDRSARLRTSSTLIDGTDSGFGNGRIPYQLDKTSGFPVVTFDPEFDVTDPDFFNDAGYARRDFTDRNDKIYAARLDGEAYVEDSFITSIQGGVRYSDHRRVADQDIQLRSDSLNNGFFLGTADEAGNYTGDFTGSGAPDPISPAQHIAASQSCRMPFRQNNYFSTTPSNLSNWAQFDATCLFNAFSGNAVFRRNPDGSVSLVDGFDANADPGSSPDPRSTSDIDVTEKIMAAYAMANFETGDGRFGGNIGVRLVDTTVESVGFRTQFLSGVSEDGNVTLTSTGEYDLVRRSNRFLNILPSLNVKFLATPDILVRGAVYKAISRPNIEDMGAGRDISTDDTGNLTIADAIAGVSGGNPQLEPLESWNADLSFEWYPKEGDLVSFAPFYKQLKAGIVSADFNATQESFIIDGQPVTVPVAQQANSDESSDLWGFEASVSHAMTYLPGLLSGLGFVGGYTYADTNFEYADPSAVDADFPLRLFTSPAQIIGLSRHTFTATGYYDKGPVQLRLIYKYRSRYLKPFELNANRFAEDGQSLDASASFDLTDNLQLRFQALNLTNHPQILERPATGAISEVSVYGRRYYAGVTARF